jgi:hypothetical protein
MDLVSLPFVLTDIHNGGCVLSQHQIIAEIKIYRFFSDFTNGCDYGLDVFHLHVHRNKTVVVFVIDVQDDLVAVPAGSQSSYLAELHQPLDPVWQKRVRRSHVDCVLVGYHQTTFLAFVDMVDLDHCPRKQNNF